MAVPGLTVQTCECKNGAGSVIDGGSINRKGIVEGIVDMSLKSRGLHDLEGFESHRTAL
jgi:hypothetical protein